MSTRDTILAAALQVLEEGGASQFSTRTVCDLAGVTAPTLYHHFGNADGLLSAAMAEVFRQFLASKQAAVQSSDPPTALREGWDDYVRFAAARPRLFAAVMGRLIEGARIEAAEDGLASLRRLVEAVADASPLSLTPAAASDLMLASANAAALLYVSALTRGAPPPAPETIAAIREAAMKVLLA
jgi:AcrR family transcriptional regulator